MSPNLCQMARFSCQPHYIQQTADFFVGIPACKAVIAEICLHRMAQYAGPLSRRDPQRDQHVAVQAFSQRMVMGCPESECPENFQDVTLVIVRSDRMSGFIR